MSRNWGIYLLAALLLFCIIVVTIGNKLRRAAGTSTTSALASAVPEAAEDGRVSGLADDPLVLFCKAETKEIEVYGLANGAGYYLSSFQSDDIHQAGLQGIKFTLEDGSLLVIAAEQANRF